MREQVEQGRTEYGFGRAAGRWADRWVRRGKGRRPATGPRPVRPARALTPVRPLELPRPEREPGGTAGSRSGEVRRCAAPGSGPGPRVLVRPGVRAREEVPLLRRVVAGIAVVAASAAVVVALGLLARAGEPVVAPAAPVAAPVLVTVEPGETVWDVAARVAPGRPGAEVAAVAERIVAENGLGSVRLEPGRVLRVAGG